MEINGFNYFLHKGYWVRMTRLPNGKQLGIYLHREIWENAHGQIPAGYIVHHKDHDRNNNNLSNLEIMSRAQHKAIHNFEREPKIYTCRSCKGEIKSISSRPRAYCSERCTRKYYYSLDPQKYCRRTIEGRRRRSKVRELLCQKQ